MLQCDALKVAHPPCRERRKVGERMTKRKRMVERQKERWQIWVVMRVGGTNSLLKKIKIKAGAQKGQDDSSFKSCQWDYIKKTSLNKAAKFNTGTWQHCTSGRRGEGKVAAVLRRTRGRMSGPRHPLYSSVSFSLPLTDLQSGSAYGTNPCPPFSVSQCINFNWPDVLFFSLGLEKILFT